MLRERIRRKQERREGLRVTLESLPPFLFPPFVFPLYLSPLYASRFAIHRWMPPTVICDGVASS